jgi:hypothetical protein
MQGATAVNLASFVLAKVGKADVAISLVAFFSLDGWRREYQQLLSIYFISDPLPSSLTAEQMSWMIKSFSSR